MHFLFGCTGGLIVSRALALRTGARGWGLVLLSVLVVGGIGALHEIVVAASIMFLGDHGMLYIGPDNSFDSQGDMPAGELGATFAAGGSVLAWRRSGAPSKRH